MAQITQDFITQFHSLPGETVKNKHQSLFKLLNKYRSLTTEELEFIAKNLQPTNHLEKILRTDFLIYFRIFDELYEDFKTGDEITARKLSKQEWFYQKAFQEISCDCEEFANKVLPSASYSLKLNILKKLPMDGEHVDEIFDAVCERYGVYLATVLIPKCTAQKIHKIFTMYPIKLTVAQLKVVYQKDPNLIFVYLEERKKLDNKSDFKDLNSLFKYMAQKSPKEFSVLFEKYKLNIQLGRRTTKRFIDCQRNSVSENVEDYLKVLNNNVAVRKMGTEIKSVLFKQYKKNWSTIIQFYPKNQQFAIFESAYNSVHHHKFGEDIDAVSKDMLKLIPDKDKRDILAKQKLDMDISYLKYVTPENCLKHVWEKLNHSCINDRVQYIKYATECCILNKDAASLLKICELVSVRLKNDNSEIRCKFLERFEDKNIFEILGEKHWKFVTDIIATGQAKGEYIPDLISIMLSYVSYLVKNGRCIKEAVHKYNNWFDINFLTEMNKDPKSQKMLLIELLETGVTNNTLDELESAQFDCKLASWCKKYNEQNPDDAIDVFDHPRLMKSIRRVLEETRRTITLAQACIYGVKYFICQPKENLQSLKNLYFQKLEVFGRISDVMWFVRHEPKTLKDNFDDFLKKFTEVYGLHVSGILWKYIKKYTHLGLDKRAVEFCKQRLGEDGYKHKEHLVKALTILASPPSHIEFVRAYIPVSEKVDLADKEVKNLYDIQGKIVRFLHYLKSPVDVLNTTFDFCKGDYLSFALSPLYSCLYKLPEAETKTFIKRLDEIKALSAKKHSMHLSCVIYDTKTIYDCLKAATVPSLMATLKYFVKNPSEDLWKILESKINALEDNEIETLKWGLDIKVPFEYRSKYMEAAWKIVEEYDCKKLRKILINTMDEETIQNFNPDFAFDVIKRCLFKSEDTNSLSLIANILIYLKSDEKFALLSDILSEFKKDSYNHPETQKTSHQTLNTFILEIFKAYMKTEDVDHEFVSKLSTLFSSIFSLSEAFEETIAIKCMTLKEVKHRKHGLVVKDETVERCSKVLLALNNDICTDYGAFAVRFISDALRKTVLYHMFASDNDKVRLCHSMFKRKESVQDCLLILDLLPYDKPEGEYSVDYEEICMELSRVTDNKVQLQFGIFLKYRSIKNSYFGGDVTTDARGLGYLYRRRHRLMNYLFSD